ncbi:helix-turn-helix domain-containing protein [Patescibacteria group bacterium]|nr:helix-turn-helix domain-containing protein [Patescibacteria group bacterium]MBU4274670.1 helix-turn-helix domain-containing protein [Patescibacteria group bacterium]MBU4367716.1 helix-turn-helix domain-containing protein [Patescibacteria group bacterium]MBU4461834.1 helix-turn-helix domain-containing protein [Patescibacteria group bacterium]MCG2700035.1 helix-turn-helix domain-containing protein [Candidatus Parcubacteria bacterium]
MDNKKIQKAQDFKVYLKRQLKNPEFKKYYDEYGKQLEIAYQILKLRKKKKISQAQLAKKIGTKQSNIARMESGQQNFSIDILEKIAGALGRDLRVTFCK